MSVYGKFDSPAQAEAHSDSAHATSSEPIIPSSTLPPEHHEHRRKKTTPGVAEQKSLWNTAIMRQAFIDAFRKLDPRWMVKNPVMFVVEVGSVLTSLLLTRQYAPSSRWLRIQSPDHPVALVHSVVCQLR